MFLRKCDRISPLITLSFKGDNKQSSILSGILSIIAYATTTIFGILYVLEFINKEKPSAYFFTRFIKDAGRIDLNSSSLFHYLYLVNKTTHSMTPLDLEMIRIVGIEQINIEVYYSSIDLELTPHWIYGFCKNYEDTYSISNLINDTEEFDNSICIRKYYNPKTKQYYDTNDQENFVWPSIEHGMSHPDYTFYGIIVEKCKNDNLRNLLGLKKCKNKEQIDNFIYSSGIRLQIIDHYSDVLNYKEPFAKYFYSISNLFYPKSYTINHMNFNPALLKTHNGIILDNVVEERSYLFSENEKVTMDEEVEIKDDDGHPVYDENGDKVYKSTGIIISFYFWLQNRLQLYDRNYKRIQDILSNIGGLSRTFFLIANILNSFFCNYFTLLDTEEFLLTVDNTNFYNEKVNNKKPISIEKINEKMSPPKRFIKNDKRNNFKALSNQRLTKDADNISKNKNSEEIIQDNQNQNTNINKKILFNSINNYKKEKNDENEIKNIEFKYENNKNNIESINQNNELNNYIIKQDKKQNFNWFKYIWYKIKCETNNPTISYYKDYRKKVISEENFICGQLDIFRLEKICKLEE